MQCAVHSAQPAVCCLDLVFECSCLGGCANNPGISQVHYSHMACLLTSSSSPGHHTIVDLPRKGHLPWQVIHVDAWSGAVWASGPCCWLDVERQTPGLMAVTRQSPVPCLAMTESTDARAAPAAGGTEPAGLVSINRLTGSAIVALAAYAAGSRCCGVLQACTSAAAARRAGCSWVVPGGASEGGCYSCGAEQAQLDAACCRGWGNVWFAGTEKKWVG